MSRRMMKRWMAPTKTKDPMGASIKQLVERVMAGKVKPNLVPFPEPVTNYLASLGDVERAIARKSQEERMRKMHRPVSFMVRTHEPARPRIALSAAALAVQKAAGKLLESQMKDYAYVINIGYVKLSERIRFKVPTGSPRRKTVTIRLSDLIELKSGGLRIIGISKGGETVKAWKRSIEKTSIGSLASSFKGFGGACGCAGPGGRFGGGGGGGGGGSGAALKEHVLKCSADLADVVLNFENGRIVINAGPTVQLVVNRQKKEYFEELGKVERQRKKREHGITDREFELRAQWIEEYLEIYRTDLRTLYRRHEPIEYGPPTVEKIVKWISENKDKAITRRKIDAVLFDAIGVNTNYLRHLHNIGRQKSEEHVMEERKFVGTERAARHRPLKDVPRKLSTRPERQKPRIFYYWERLWDEHFINLDERPAFEFNFNQFLAGLEQRLTR